MQRQMKQSPIQAEDYLMTRSRRRICYKQATDWMRWKIHLPHYTTIKNMYDWTHTIARQMTEGKKKLWPAPQQKQTTKKKEHVELNTYSRKKIDGKKKNVRNKVSMNNQYAGMCDPKEWTVKVEHRGLLR